MITIIVGWIIIFGCLFVISLYVFMGKISKNAAVHESRFTVYPSGKEAFCKLCKSYIKLSPGRHAEAMNNHMSKCNPVVTSQMSLVKNDDIEAQSPRAMLIRRTFTQNETLSQESKSN